MRRGFVTAGTWCVDKNVTLPAWPEEDINSILQSAGSTFAEGCQINVSPRSENVPG